MKLIEDKIETTILVSDLVYGDAFSYINECYILCNACLIDGMPTDMAAAVNLSSGYMIRISKNEEVIPLETTTYYRQKVNI